MHGEAKVLILMAAVLIPVGAIALVFDAMYSGMTASLVGIMCLALGIVESWMDEDEH